MKSCVDKLTDTQIDELSSLFSLETIALRKTCQKYNLCASCYMQLKFVSIISAMKAEGVSMDHVVRSIGDALSNVGTEVIIGVKVDGDNEVSPPKGRPVH